MFQSRQWRVVARVATATVLVTGGLGIGPADAQDQAGRTAVDAVSVFASAPAPGHPFGIADGDGQVYVSTSAGDFFADP
jgi:hypothetical protein